MGEQLLTKAETAKRLQVTERTIDAWRETGRLRAIKLGPGTIRFRAEAIEEFLTQNEERQPQSAGV
ncbi:helix-turn-helix transcriptional regulator [Lacunimicrobium album]